MTQEEWDQAVARMRRGKKQSDYRAAEEDSHVGPPPTQPVEWVIYDRATKEILAEVTARGAYQAWREAVIMKPFSACLCVMREDLLAAAEKRAQRKNTKEAPVKTALVILEESPGGRLFKTAQDVDDYVKKERESWEDPSALERQIVRLRRNHEAALDAAASMTGEAQVLAFSEAESIGRELAEKVKRLNGGRK